MKSFVILALLSTISADCGTYADEGTCDTDETCTWCTSAAEDPSCKDLETARGLPRDVYKCDGITGEVKTKNAKPKKIVAVGDSITEGVCSSDEATHSWPSQLNDIFNDQDSYSVQNLGVSGRTMMKNGDYPYWNETAYQDALNSEADIMILMLGTNDAKTFQWN